MTATIISLDDMRNLKEQAEDSYTAAVSFFALRVEGIMQQASHTVQVLGFWDSQGRAYPKEKFKTKAMERCLEYFSPSEGWYEHRVAIAHFDPHEWAKNFPR
jgi:hypothetical protein